MEIVIPYSQEEIKIQIGEKYFAGKVYPNQVDRVDEGAVLTGALNNPIQSKSFDAFLEDAKDILFIVNDGTRPTPTAKVLDMLSDRISNHNIRFLVATGVHRAPTEDELKHIFGKNLNNFRSMIHIHDSTKDEDMVHLGMSKNGTEMVVNRLGVEADKIVIIGSVEPHYFAGYTGGRKAFLPGIASYRTIEQNHRLALKPSARALVLDGNPVHEDMEDAIQKIRDKEIFSIMTVLDRDDRIFAATAGDLSESFKAAVEKSHQVFSVNVDQKTDIVVAVAPYPMDVDLYQAQKALENAKLALNPDGILLLVAKCPGGVGHTTFVDLLSSASDPQDALNQIEKKYVLGYHKAAKIAEIAQWAHIWAVTSLDPEILKSVFIRPFKDIQTALDEAIAARPDGKVLFLMAASITVPRIPK